MLQHFKRTALRHIRSWHAMVSILLMVGLGAAAGSAAIAVVDVVLLNPLQVAAPNRLVMFREAFPSLSGSLSSATDFLDYVPYLRGFDGVAAYSDHEGGANVIAGGQAFRARGAEITTAFFQTLGVALERGRGFTASERAPGHNRVVVISDMLWRRAFGGAPDVTNRTLLLNRVEFTVVGVAPPGFRFPRTSEFWIPVSLGSDRIFTGAAIAYSVFGRLSPGCSTALADRNWKDVAHAVGRAHPSSWIGRRAVRFTPLSDVVVGNAKPSLQVLVLALALVWVCAVANTSTLLLTRSAGYHAELAVRWSLGARPAQLLGHVLADALLVFVLGVACGFAATWAGLRLIVHYLPSQYGGTATPGPHVGVLLFIIALSAMTTGAAMMPAVRRTLMRTGFEFSHVNQGSGRIGSLTRFASASIVLQVAVAVVLVTGTLALVARLVELQRTDPGFAPGNAVAIGLTAAGPDRTSPQTERAVVEAVLTRAANMPNVRASGATSALPLGDSDLFSLLYQVVGRPSPKEFDERFAMSITVTPDYARALGMTLVAGRFFDAHDTASSTAVAVVNRALARHYGDDHSMVGQRLTMPGRATPVEVIGVVGNVRQLGLQEEAGQQIFLPHTQSASRLQTLVFRTDRSPSDLVPGLRTIVHDVDPSSPLYNVTTLAELVRGATARQRFLSGIIGLFALVTATLAAVGIYGSLAQFVSQRRREVALRMALGAGRAEVARLIVGRAVRLTLFGITTGILLSFVLLKFAAQALSGVQVPGAFSYGIAAAIVVAIAGAASLGPTLVAASVDPAALLRDE